MVYYGILLAAPELMSALFNNETFTGTLMLDQVYLEGLIAISIGTSGGVLSILYMRYRPLKELNIVGALFNAIMFIAFSVMQLFRNVSRFQELTVFIMLTIGLNFGPNIATFVLPMVVYPQSVRGTFHGLSAAIGKLGAIVGAFLFPALRGRVTIVLILLICAMANLISIFLSLYFLPSNDLRGDMVHEEQLNLANLDDEDDDEEDLLNTCRSLPAQKSEYNCPSRFHTSRTPRSPWKRIISPKNLKKQSLQAFRRNNYSETTPLMPKAAPSYNRTQTHQSGYGKATYASTQEKYLSANDSTSASGYGRRNIPTSSSDSTSP